MQALTNVIGRLQTIQNEQYTPAIKSGFDILDRLLRGGFQKGNLYFIAGEESIGKTAFTVSVINNIIHSNTFRAGIISLDISEERMIERILSNLSGVRLEAISRGKLQEHEKQILYKSSLLSEVDKIEIAGNNFLDLKNIQNICRSWVENQNVQILFIDYLQLISLDVADNEEVKNSIIAEFLKDLALNLNVPIIVTVALNDTCVSDLKKLRKAGQIEPYADTILFLNKPSQDYNLFNIEEKILHLSIRKNNTGLLDTVKLRALFHIQKLIEFDYN